ncbi:uncharacterized protein LOC127251980 [Andrographis paniculata]|uniref:uncharacterized protein LOC127251980 n=1 Tax=Andrographis paniculata TaxID=175694 RepID=UPI0021E6E062|nr:uncharacterized protein LOC127251980 [Andrographis paniculata]
MDDGKVNPGHTVLAADHNETARKANDEIVVADQNETAEKVNGGIIVEHHNKTAGKVNGGIIVEHHNKTAGKVNGGITVEHHNKTAGKVNGGITVEHHNKTAGKVNGGIIVEHHNKTAGIVNGGITVEHHNKTAGKVNGGIIVEHHNKTAGKVNGGIIVEHHNKTAGKVNGEFVVSDHNETAGKVNGSEFVVADHNETAGKVNGGEIVVADHNETAGKVNGGEIVVADHNETAGKVNGGEIVVADHNETAEKVNGNLQPENGEDHYEKWESEKVRRKRYMKKGKAKVADDPNKVYIKSMDLRFTCGFDYLDYSDLDDDDDDDEKKNEKVDDVGNGDKDDKEKSDDSAKQLELKKKLAQEEYDFKFAMMLQVQENINRLPLPRPPHCGGEAIGISVPTFADRPDWSYTPPPNHVQMDTGNWMRNLPGNDICVTKVLTEREVVPGGHLYLNDIYEAAALSDEPELVDNPSLVQYKVISMSGTDDIEYRMVLRQYPGEDDDGNVSYRLTHGWDQYVRVHGLKAGDQIDIYSMLDERLTEGSSYFVIKYFRKSPFLNHRPVIPSEIERSPLSLPNQLPMNHSAYRRVESRPNENGGVVLKFSKQEKKEEDNELQVAADHNE